MSDKLYFFGPDGRPHEVEPALLARLLAEREELEAEIQAVSTILHEREAHALRGEPYHDHSTLQQLAARLRALLTTNQTQRQP